MKIIELYGYSCSGKSYAANEINLRENIDLSFSKISKKNRIFRFLTKLSFVFLVKYSDLIFIYNIHREFKFLKIKYKLKNFFSFLYLVGFIRDNVKKNKSVIIDHGIFQCLLLSEVLLVQVHESHAFSSQSPHSYAFENTPVRRRRRHRCHRSRHPSLRCGLHC